MPLYFFSIRGDQCDTEDLEGTELSNVEAVRHEAREIAKELLVHSIESDRPIGHRHLDVTDESGRSVLIYPLRDALED